MEGTMALILANSCPTPSSFITSLPLVFVQGEAKRPNSGPCVANPVGNYEYCDPSFTPRDVMEYREGQIGGGEQPMPSPEPPELTVVPQGYRGLPPSTTTTDSMASDSTAPQLGKPVYPGSKWRPGRRLSTDSSDLDDNSSVEEYELDEDSTPDDAMDPKYLRKVYRKVSTQPSPHSTRHSALQAMSQSSKHSYHGGVYSPHPVVINGLKSVLLLSEDDASILCDVQMTAEDVTHVKLRSSEFWWVAPFVPWSILMYSPPSFPPQARLCRGASSAVARSVPNAHFSAAT